MFFIEHLSIKWEKGSLRIRFIDKNGKILQLAHAIEKILNRFKAYMLDFELLIVRIAGLIPIFFLRRIIYWAAGVKLGRGAHLHMGTQFFYPAGVEIGEGSIIGQNAFLDGRDSLVIGKYVDIATDVMIYNSSHNIHSEDFEAVTRPVEIEDYCFLGPRVIVLPGVKIGKGAIVAAGAVVTKDVGEFSIVAGVPAQVIGERGNQDPHYKLGRARLFQ